MIVYDLLLLCWCERDGMIEQKEQLRFPTYVEEYRGYKLLIISGVQ